MKKFVLKNILTLLVMMLSILSGNASQLIGNNEASSTMLDLGVAISGSTSVIVNDIKTYTAFPAPGIIITKAKWIVRGGTVQSSTTTSVTILWTTVGTGTIDYLVLLSNVGSLEATLSVNVSAVQLPNTPPNPTILSELCSSAELQKSGTIPTGEMWYWQETNSNGTSTTLAATSNYTATTSGIFYIRAKNLSTGLWSTSSGYVSVTLGDTGGTIWYADMDQDGFGDPDVSLIQCTQPANYVSNSDDQCPLDFGIQENHGCPVVSSLSNENYIYTVSPQVPVSDVSQLTSNKDVIKSVTYYDGLGRAKQSVGIGAGGDKLGNNLIDWETNWALGSGSSPFFNQNGLTTENERIMGIDPYGNESMLWKCGNDALSDADGGWNTNYFPIDNTVAYRYSVWVKRTGSQDGMTHLGTQNVNNLSGTANSNPYFWYGDTPQTDQWYLLVGVIYPHTYTGTQSIISGVYDINGNIVISGTDYKWSSTSTTTSFRSYFYYSTDINTKQYFYDPIVQQLDGNEATIAELIEGHQGKDIVTHIEYDSIGRQAKEYMPYAASTNRGMYRADALTATEDYYKTRYSSEIDQIAPNPYSQKLFDNSPLNRVLEQTAPGESWDVGANFDINGHSDGHTIKIAYETNIADEVKLYSVLLASDYTPTLQTPTVYGAGQLYKNITKDENWTSADGLNHTTEEFTNKQGQVVLKRTYNAGLKHDTYYVYDDFGNLSYVLPPKMEASTAIIDTINNQINELGYQYKYDKRNRLIEKRIPGSDWVYIVYDKLDRPTLSQDANLRAENKWIFTKYDQLGRVAYTGFHTNSSYTTQATMQVYFDSQYTSNASLYETKESPGFESSFYSNDDFPKLSIEILTINHYDDYTTDLAGSFNPVTNNMAIYDVYPTTRTKGLSTISKTKVLETSSWITTVMYYDEKAHPIYVYNRNNYLETTETVKSKLDFVGKVIETTSMHTYENDALPSIAIVDKYYYDHAGRLLKQKQKINTQAEEVIAQNNYDDLGQLISKGVGGTSYQARLQNIDYTFNIRGWLKGINDPNNLGTDLFGFKLNYNTPEISGSTAMFNGNISETIWKTKNDETSTTPWVQRAYGYQYDPLNRITKGDFKIKNSSGVYVSSNYTEYSLSNVTYDKNGNIRTLRRYTNSGYYPMDDLTYSYDTGNKLLKVVDNGYYSIKDEGFKDGINTGNDYTYDGNGNLKEDKNKGIADIIYNYLNLPSQITFASGNIQYIYNATGTKQKKIVTEATGTTTTIYAGNYIYQNNALQMISQPEGYLEPNGQGGYDYGYRLKDHLGNIRLTFIDFDHNGSIALSEITEENNYYPFGLKHQGYNNTISSNTNAVASKFKYNGKELNDELGLDLYDYGARYHMLDLGRFTTQDALAEYYYDQSPYNYVANNPISFLDPDGNFRTKFGAWLWKTFNGGGDILQDKGGEYFVSQQVEYTGEGAGIAVKRTFDREGRREGKDLEFEAQKEAFLTQYEFKQTMESMGVEVYYTDDINEARSSMLQIPSMVVIPNVLKSATGVVNTAKQGGKINANSLKELKSLIQKLSKPSSELTKKELHQFTKLVEKYGGKIRKDLNPVKGKIRKPHVQVEGLGKSIENRHIWLKNGVN